MNKKESSFRFTNPKISELMFAPTGEDTPSDLKSILTNINLKSEVERESDSENATVTLTITNFDKDDLENNNTDKLPYLIRMGYTADFKWSDNMPNERVEGFLKINAPALLLGYIRPQFAEITSKSGFETINLPFLDFTNNEIDE